MPFAVLPIFQALGSGLLSLLSSRFGQIVTAFAVAWVWAGWRADDHWRAVIAAEQARAEAVYQAEVARQARAAQEIAAAATARAEEDAALERELRTQIEAFNAVESGRENKVTVETGKLGQKPHETVSQRSSPACAIDGDFAGVVRRFDTAAAGRKARSSSRPR